MIEIIKTPELWIALAVVAVLIFGMGALKKYLKKIATKCDKKEQKEQQSHYLYIKNCIAVVKENAESEMQLPKVVCPKMQDRPLCRERLAQICEINGDIYSFSFSAVGCYQVKTQINQGLLCCFRLSRDIG